MRRRMCPENGLGNNSPHLFTNNGLKPPQKVASLVIGLYFKETLGCDFKRTENFVNFGIEPAYQGDDLIMVTVHRNKKKSSLTTGRAFGYYGRGIRKKTRVYKEYKYKSKFVKFVDEAHEILFGSKETK